MKPYVDANKQKEIHKLLDDLISDYNTFESIQEWTEKSLGEYWTNASIEVENGGNYGWSMVYKVAISKMLIDLGVDVT